MTSGGTIYVTWREKILKSELVDLKGISKVSPSLNWDSASLWENNVIKVWSNHK